MTYGLLLAGGGLLFLGTQLQVDTPYLADGAGVHDHGPRHGVGDGADDGRRDELGRTATRRPGLGHDEHQPRGGRGLRDRAPRHGPHDQAQGVADTGARGHGAVERSAERDRRRRQPRHPRPVRAPTASPPRRSARSRRRSIRRSWPGSTWRCSSAAPCSWSPRSSPTGSSRGGTLCPCWRRASTRRRSPSRPSSRSAPRGRGTSRPSAEDRP